MQERYYLTDDQAQELKCVLNAEKDHAPDLVAKVHELVFGTPIPDDPEPNFEPS
ncbi:hypothetical protein [Ketogulonicigenium robustum]|uniref:hypothetical protein n=1 Tax=Ketogulonicigenium robustum TaxID=92947 RepID=UPI0018DD4E01|nr:hypothetical protein [Ketogulonicigenium robustum]